MLRAGGLQQQYPEYQVLEDNTMAQPFFNTNYRVASTAPAAALIAQAGQTQGQMFSDMGKQIGGMIEQYGLNKEKRRKEEDTAMGTLAGMSPQELLQIGQENPKLGKAIERATSDQATPRDFQLINASAAPIMAGQLRRVKMEGLQNANKMAELNFGIAKELKDTKINIAKNQGVLSDLATKIAQETDAKKRELLKVELQNQIDNITRLGQPRIEAEEAKLKAVPRQVEREEELGELSVKAAKRADESADFLLEAFGGAEGKAEFDYQGALISRKNLEKGLEYLDARINYTNYLSTAKNVPIDTKKKYASLVSHSGKILDTIVEDPNTGNQITFQEYMEKANDEPRLYPLTGKGSGAAGVLYGNFQDTQKQIIDFGKTILVQVNVPEELGNQKLDNQGQPIDPSILARRQAGNLRKPPPFDPLEKGQIRGLR